MHIYRDSLFQQVHSSMFFDKHDEKFYQVNNYSTSQHGKTRCVLCNTVLHVFCYVIFGGKKLEIYSIALQTIDIGQGDTITHTNLSRYIA